ncbi:MAG: 50S ribosomal protein L32 [Synergistales bacterium]|nr:50S ribosomal protein L32 [Synergistaceae bacterium]MDY6399624.1 50S ribosomal protein L32 [Synergistales bacterium]MDY6400939.1 50S ribosomal protein L32 [Synergistales bacterium]MDY6405355.1 50S ribosomal protein L32 [Synergistales bacterium]MDY6410717.1 50S ribosomal protein L32 [Synergistales bacterium]
MATPKRKVSHARTAQRKAQWLRALSAPQTMDCPHCGEVTLVHHACPSCGFYRSRQVVKVKSAEE